MQGCQLVESHKSAGSSVVDTFSEPATMRVTLPKTKLIWQNSCIRSCQSSAFFDFCGLISARTGALFEHDFHRCERCPAAKEYAGGAQAICSFTFPMKLGTLHYLCDGSVACETSCAPLLSGPPLGGTQHSDHHDFFAYGPSMATIQSIEGLLDKLI